jgi:hypothetical protein
MGLSGPHSAKLSHLLYLQSYAVPSAHNAKLSHLLYLQCYAVPSAHNAKLSHLLYLQCYAVPSAHNAKLLHLLYCTYNAVLKHLPTMPNCTFSLLCYDGPSVYTAIVHNSGNLKTAHTPRRVLWFIFNLRIKKGLIICPINFTHHILRLPFLIDTR